MLNLRIKYYVDTEHCHRKTMESWATSNGWSLIGEELDFPDYGKVCRLDAWRDKSPANLGELMGMKRQDSLDVGIEVVGGMISNIRTDDETSVIIWPILQNG